jgi:histidyl-tRNA synthetase
MTEKLELSTAKGFRDFPPEEKILRDKVINQIKQVFELYGFSPLETPTIERLDVLTAKFGAGEESDIVGELYKLKDQGNRELGLRYEFTFALARYIGMNPQIKLPFKRYQIGPVFRDGPIKAGRYREFYQCDVDTVGTYSMISDAEIISLLEFVFKKLNLEIDIEINSRKLLTDILDYAGIVDNQERIIITIDKLKKIGVKKVTNELKEKNVDLEKITKLLNILSIKGDNQEKLNKISSLIGEDKEGIKELKELFSYLELFNVKYTFLPSLARGLGYYTGPIFEVFLKDKSLISSSIAGGGRWDKMIGKYIDKNIEYPATGVALGLEPIMEIIKQRDGLKKKTTATLFIIPIGKDAQKKAINVSKLSREQGINTLIDLIPLPPSSSSSSTIPLSSFSSSSINTTYAPRSVKKNLDFANKLGVEYVGFLGDNEIKENKIKIKNMITGKEQLVDFDKIKEIIV